MLTSTVLWVLTYVLHSSLLIGGVWLATKIAHKRLALSAQEALWKAALLGGIVTATMQTAFIGVSPLSPLQVPLGLQTPVAAVTPPVLAEPVPPVEAQPQIEPEPRSRKVIVIESRRPGELVIVTESEQPDVAPAVAAPVAVEPPIATAEVAAPPPEPAPARTWLPFAMAVLGFGAMLGLVRVAASFWRLHQRLRFRRDVLEDPTLEIFLRLQQRAGLQKNGRVRLRASRYINAPVALVRSEVVIPERVIEELKPGMQEALLAHELGHVVRRDSLWALATAIISAVLFFQPLNRLAKRKLAEVCEMQCDDWAVALIGRGTALARCLAEVAGWNIEPTPYMPVAAMDGGAVTQRVKRLLDDAQKRSDGRLGKSAFLMAGSVAVVCGLLVPAVADAGNATPADAVEDPAATPVLAANTAKEERKEAKALRKLEKKRSEDETVTHLYLAPPAPPAPPPPPAPGFSFEMYGDGHGLRGRFDVQLPELKGLLDLDVDLDDLDGAFEVIEREELDIEELARDLERALEDGSVDLKHVLKQLERSGVHGLRLEGVDADAIRELLEKARIEADTHLDRDALRRHLERAKAHAHRRAQLFREDAEQLRQRAEQARERAEAMRAEARRRQHERRIRELERELEREQRMLERFEGAEEESEAALPSVSPTVYTL